MLVIVPGARDPAVKLSVMAGEELWKEVEKEEDCCCSVVRKRTKPSATGHILHRNFKSGKI